MSGIFFFFFNKTKSYSASTKFRRKGKKLVAFEPSPSVGSMIRLSLGSVIQSNICKVEIFIFKTNKNTTVL